MNASLMFVFSGKFLIRNWTITGLARQALYGTSAFYNFMS